MKYLNQKINALTFYKIRIKKKSKKVKRCNPIRMTKENDQRKWQKKWP